MSIGEPGTKPDTSFWERENPAPPLHLPSGRGVGSVRRPAGSQASGPVSLDHLGPRSSYLSLERRNETGAPSRRSPLSEEADLEDPGTSLPSSDLASHSAELRSQDSAMMSSGW